MFQIFILFVITLFIIAQFALFTKHIFRFQFTNPIKYFFIGLFFLTGFLRCLHFLIPLNGQLLIILLVGSTIHAFFFKKETLCLLTPILHFFKDNKIYLFILGLLLSLSSLTSISYDDGLYHSGFIKWMNEFPVVKGLANLHSRLGFNSNWHLISAGFNGFGIFRNESNCINLSLVVFFLLYFYFENREKKDQTYLTTILFLFFPLLFIYHFIDPSADLVICFFSMAFLLEVKETEEYNKKNDFLFWMICLIFLLTIKITTVLLAPIFVYYVFIILKSNSINVKKTIQISLYFAVFLWIPYIISNYIISGYYLYPYLKINTFPILWQVADKVAANEIDGINYASVMRWCNISIEQAKTLSKSAKFILLIKELRLIEKSLYLLILFGGLFLLVKNYYKRTKQFYIFIFLGFAVYFFLFFDFRFIAAFGFVIILLLLQSFPFLNRVLMKFLPILICLQLVTTYILYKHLFPKILKTNKKADLVSLGYKQPYFDTELKNYQLDQINIIYPSNNEFCWNNIPCSLKPNTDLRLIGRQLQDGFYCIKNGTNSTDRK